ncbi:MAG TPA: methionyl-tRNA formyltransferase [Firmicutes bacterium]|uniref:Methionyl-tRNA formyltransferase n=1 Tax=Capillibacterium thermochitinicola TaxID=2699427 RepID=A0A8J6I0U2_9FIRM|nr:methionyl-tRNA formyltransferase [Capillibacterium thermochitinicola]MBA2133560.1 methionyl-tRNA formyltransferase [Capillibacterium thermochitinicola]HHW12348.1 methionyl-tRNA formyltransferase [Bacillota bacterium]
MRVVFMGTPEFAAVSLRSLLAAGHQVVGVVTQPDRPRGRGMKLSPSPVKQLAMEHNLPVVQPERLPDAEVMVLLAETRPEVIVVVAYGLKIPPVILNYPPHGCVNVHASLLPKYRGASPIQAVLLNGETITGVTTMRMDEGWDTGDLLLSRQVPIDPDENFGSLHDRLAVVGGEVLLETLAGLAAGTVQPVPQNHAEATYVPKLTEEDLVLVWTDSTMALHNRIRAFSPVPGARTFLHGEILKVWAARPGQGWYGLEGARPGTIGAVTKEEGGGLPVRTGDGVLLLTEIQSPGKKRLPVLQFVAGNPLTPGIILG